VAAVVGVSGVYEFRDQGDPDDFVAFLGGTEAECPDQYRAAAPVAHVHPDAPPALLLHGADDDVVPPRSSELLASALEEVGAPVEYESYAGADHVFLHSSAHYADTLSRVREFLGAHL
jgi:dipeptidyl aminopeptidase/acylaminoacyl peptidase